MTSLLFDPRDMKSWMSSESLERNGGMICQETCVKPVNNETITRHNIHLKKIKKIKRFKKIGPIF